MKITAREVHTKKPDIEINVVMTHAEATEFYDYIMSRRYNTSTPAVSFLAHVRTVLCPYIR
jgi:hypothetical protein